MVFFTSRDRLHHRDCEWPSGERLVVVSSIYTIVYVVTCECSGILSVIFMDKD